jgi:hypothetical protein
MKRTRQMSHARRPTTPELPTTIADTRLAEIKGGATAIEYGLAVPPPRPTQSS